MSWLYEHTLNQPIGRDYNSKRRPQVINYLKFNFSNLQPSCPHIDELIDYSEGILDLNLNKEIEMHLRECVACKEIVDISTKLVS
jgi:hypothetical protein